MLGTQEIKVPISGSGDRHHLQQALLHDAEGVCEGGVPGNARYTRDKGTVKQANFGHLISFGIILKIVTHIF
jgi:hypothetical protein